MRGRRLDQIAAERVPLAVEQVPLAVERVPLAVEQCSDLVTLFGGGNDVPQVRCSAGISVSRGVGWPSGGW